MLGPIVGSVKGIARRAAAACRAALGGDMLGGGEACERVVGTCLLDRQIRNQLAACSIQKAAFTRVTNAEGAEPLDR